MPKPFLLIVIALRTIFDDTTIAGLTKDDRHWANASLQNLYAGMIWMGNKNRIALHKVDKHFQEAKQYLSNMNMRFTNQGLLKTTRQLERRSIKESPGFMLKNILCNPFGYEWDC